MVPIRMSGLLSLIHKRFFTTTSAAAAATSAPELSSTSPLPSSSSSSSITLQFLTSSCGLPLQSALSVSKKFQIHPIKLHNSQSVLQLLKAHNFAYSHIAKLIQKRPEVLHSSVESTLKPKFDFLVRNGMVGKLLPDLIAADPHILKRDLDSHIKPFFEFLRSILGRNENITAVLKRAGRLLSFGCKDTLERNVGILREEGVPFDRIAKLLRRYTTAMTLKHDRVIYVVNVLKNLGIKPEATMFIYAFGVMMQMNESRWTEKTEMMKSLGWSEEDVLNVFKRFPTIFGFSEKKIRVGMEFFLETMKLEHNVVIDHPYFLGFSVDKRIHPRYKVIKVLQSKKLINLDLEKNIGSWLGTNEKNFLKIYVLKYVKEVPDLLEIYRGTEKTENIDA